MIFFVLVLASFGILLGVISVPKLLVEVSSTPEPLPVTLEELKEHIPSNRHLAIVGAKLDFSKYYVHELGSVAPIKRYFVPLKPSNLNASKGTRPLVFLEITPQQFELFKSQWIMGHATSDPMSGLRLLKDPALLGPLWKKFEEEYSSSDLQKIVILDFNDRPSGNWKLPAVEAAVSAGFIMMSIGMLVLMRKRFQRLKNVTY